MHQSRQFYLTHVPTRSISGSKSDRYSGVPAQRRRSVSSFYQISGRPMESCKLVETLTLKNNFDSGYRLLLEL